MAIRDWFHEILRLSINPCAGLFATAAFFAGLFRCDGFEGVFTCSALRAFPVAGQLVELDGFYAFVVDVPANTLVLHNCVVWVNEWLFLVNSFFRAGSICWSLATNCQAPAHSPLYKTRAKLWNTPISGKCAAWRRPKTRAPPVFIG